MTVVHDVTTDLGQGADPIVSALSALVVSTFDALLPVADALSAIAESAEVGSISSNDLAPLRTVTHATVQSHPLLIGSGVALEPDWLSDKARYVEWVHVGDDPNTPSRLREVDPAGDAAYDYPSLDWFRVPRLERRRMVGGPYFDLRGANRATLTFSVPVLAGSVFIGVAAADVPLTGMQSELLPLLRRLKHPAALLNHENRSIAANTPAFVTSGRVHPERLGDGILMLPVIQDLGWHLLITEGA